MASKIIMKTRSRDWKRKILVTWMFSDRIQYKEDVESSIIILKLVSPMTSTQSLPL